MAAHRWQHSYLYNTRCPTHFSPSHVLTNHVAAITHIYTAPSVQLLTAATASLSSAHQAGIKERSSNLVSSDIQRPHQSVSTLGPERPVFGVIGTTLRQGQLPWPSGGHAQCARQLAASTCRWPYPTHWVTGTSSAADNPATALHDQVSSTDQATTTYNRRGCTTSANSATTPQPGNFRQPPHCYQCTHHYLILPAHTAPHHRPEPMALYRAPQTLRSGLSITTTFPTQSNMV
jgi:hypothetical protein